jgi:hypothetical protein
LHDNTAAKRGDDAGDLIEARDSRICLDFRHSLLVNSDPLPEVCLAELPIFPKSTKHGFKL